MRVYKLTDGRSETKRNTVWGEGVSHEAPGEGTLCSAGWIHCYIDPHIAAFMHKVHVPFENPILWEAEAEPPFKCEGQLKMGCRKLTTIRKLPLPTISIEQRVEVAIRCALAVGNKTDEFTAWANDWLAGIDRSKASAFAVMGTWWDAVKMLCGPSKASRAASLMATRAASLMATIAPSRAARVELEAEAAAVAASAAAWASTEAEEKKEEFDLLAIIKEVMQLQERGGDSESV